MEEDEVVEPVEEKTQDAAEKPESAKSLYDELVAYGDDEPADDGATDSPEPEATPAGQPAATPSLFDQVLPDDERLPKPYRGKLTVGGLIENERKLVTEFNRAREEANTLKTKLQVQTHLIESLGAIGESVNRNQEQSAPLTEADIWKNYGIEDINAEWFDNPSKVLGAIYQRVRDEQAVMSKPVVERVQQWEQETQHERESRAQQQAWSSARELLAKVGDEVPPDVWVKRSPEVMQMVQMDRQRWASDPVQQQERIDPIADPLAYAAAYRTVMQRWEAPMASTSAAGGNGRVQPKQPVVSNPPHATRATGATSTTPKVSSRMEAEIKEWAREWKMPIEKVREMFLEVESEGR